MSEKEKRMLHVGHCTGLLHAYYLLVPSRPVAAEDVADAYHAYCRLWGVFDHISGDPNTPPVSAMEG